RDQSLFVHTDVSVESLVDDESSPFLACSQGLFNTFTLCYVPDGGNGEKPLGRAERAQTDFHGNFRSILAKPAKVQPGSHGPHVRVSKVTFAIARMLGAKALGN